MTEVAKRRKMLMIQKRSNQRIRLARKIKDLRSIKYSQNREDGISCLLELSRRNYSKLS